MNKPTCPRHTPPTTSREWAIEFAQKFFVYRLGGKYPDHVGAEKDAIAFISSLLQHQAEEILEEYTQWLCKHNYVDADVYAEEPTAIEQFLIDRVVKTTKA